MDMKEDTFDDELLFILLQNLISFHTSIFVTISGCTLPVGLFIEHKKTVHATLNKKVLYKIYYLQDAVLSTYWHVCPVGQVTNVECTLQTLVPVLSVPEVILTETLNLYK
jgi:hypothetical protein